jgi:hypothetical protein
MFGRRSHSRFTINPASDGLFRIVSDVIVQPLENHQWMAISRQPGVVGELLAVEILGAERRFRCAARVAESGPLVTDGALRHRIRLEPINPRTEQPADGESEAFAVLARELQIRVLNCSLSGCLLEASAPLAVGTMAALTFCIDGHEFEDDVRVTRCDPIAGAGSRCHIGAEFLWTALPGRRSLRFAMQQRLTTPVDLRPGM